MGNDLFTDVKVNVTSYNATNDKTSTQAPSLERPGPGSLSGTAQQSITEIDTELACFGTLSFLAITLNIVTLILLEKKFKTIPHALVLNIVVIDLLTPLISGPLFMLGLMFPMIWTMIPNACNITGFFHATLGTVFVNSVTLIAVSRYLGCFKPQVYHRVFVNKVNVRILLLAVWTSSALICVPPMVGWGAYQRFEATCWLAWFPSNKAHIVYNAMATILPLGVALVSCIAGFRVVLNCKKVHAAPNPSQLQSLEQNIHIAEPATITPRVNTEIFIITVIQFVVYILLWVPLTVIHSFYLKDWRMVDIRITISLLFLYFGRSLFNPIILFAVNSDFRRKFVDLLCRCKCSPQREQADIEM